NRVRTRRKSGVFPTSQRVLQRIANPPSPVRIREGPFSLTHYHRSLKRHRLKVFRFAQWLVFAFFLCHQYARRPHWFGQGAVKAPGRSLGPCPSRSSIPPRFTSKPNRSTTAIVT